MLTWNARLVRQGNCIAIRYTGGMTAEITTDEYRALAQQYLLLLAIRGLPAGAEATIQTLAERLVLKHHSTVELIDRLETHGYVRRSRGRDDRRRVMVSLLPRGERLLEQVARHRIGELRSNGHALVRAIDQLLQKPPQSNSRKTRSNREKAQSKRTTAKRGTIRESH